MSERPTLQKRIIFRIAAVVLSLLSLVCFELVLRFAGVGEVREADVPAIGFQATYSLFERNQSGSRYQIAKSRQAYFYPDSFAAEKAKDEFRIFCLGGSTVQGRPYSIETSFTTWLELSLNAADPGRQWEVVNCGGVSYASYRLVNILREVLSYQPDLIVLYTGHNEFLEARTFPNRPFAAPVSRIRTFNLLRSIWLGDSRLEERLESPEILAAEVDALLDYRGGLAAYHRNDRIRDAIVRQYEDNLAEMIAIAESANVPVLLMNPVSNLRDTPPFKIEPRSGQTATDAVTFERLLQQARDTNNTDAKVELLERAVAVDDRHAGARFLLGHAYLARNQPDEARKQFIAAKDEDVCPLRMIEPLHDALRRVADSTSTPLLDVSRDFESRADDGIPGDRFFLDHIHPSINNHQAIARLLVDQLIATGVCQPQSNWEMIRDERFRDHLGTLDTPYYAKGKQRLEGLIRWTQGRANKLRDGTLLPPGLDEPLPEPNGNDDQ